MRSEVDSHAGSHVVNVRTYLVIAAILAVVTLIEYVIVGVPALRSVVKPVLFILSAAKFALVALYFMHLKFDRKLLTWLFVAGILLATVITVSLVALLRNA